MTTFKKTARWAGLAAVSAMVLSAAPALGEANEYFKCTLKEGSESAALVAVGKDAVALMAKNGVEGISVAYLFPLYAEDISRGTFFWQGTAPNFAGLGAMNDFWDSDANEAVRERWSALIDGCEASSAYSVVRAE